MGLFWDPPAGGDEYRSRINNRLEDARRHDNPSRATWGDRRQQTTEHEDGYGATSDSLLLTLGRWLFSHR